MKAVLHESPLERYEMVYAGKTYAEISGESVVSDKMPDIGLLGTTSTQVLLRSKRTEMGAAIMEGDLAVDVCYIPDGAAGLCILKMQLPWLAEFLSDEISGNHSPIGFVRLIQIETRMLNPRKILVKAKLEGEMRVFNGNSTTICDAVETDDMIQVRTEEVDCSVVSTVCEKTFVATDEYPLPPQLNDVEVIGKNVQYRIDDIKTLTNKLIVKGCVLSDVMLCSTEGETEKISFTSAFSFIAETDCEELSDCVRVDIMPTAMYYEVNASGRVLSVEVHGVCQMTVYGKRHITYLSDSYSNFYPCQYNCTELSVYGDVKKQLHREKVAESVVCRSQLSCVRFLCGSHTESGSQINVLVEAYVQYENGTTDWIRKQVALPIKLNDGENICEVHLSDLYGTCSGTELEFRFNIEWETMTEVKMVLTPLICIELDEENPLPLRDASLTVTRWQGDLWELARKYKSTVQQIRMYNDIEGDDVPTERMLLIPRQKNK